MQVEALRDAASGGDVSKVAVAQSEAALAAQGKLLGALAGILGDDAYTVIGLKGRYLASAKTLFQLPAGPEAAEAASRSLGEMAKILTDVRALVPAEVVAQACHSARTVCRGLRGLPSVQSLAASVPGGPGASPTQCGRVRKGREDTVGTPKKQLKQWSRFCR